MTRLDIWKQNHPGIHPNSEETGCDFAFRLLRHYGITDSEVVAVVAECLGMTVDEIMTVAEGTYVLSEEQELDTHPNNEQRYLRFVRALQAHRPRHMTAS